MDCWQFLARPPKGTPRPVYVLAGDEALLKREALAALKTWIIGPDPEFGLSAYPGDDADFSMIRDELATLPFTGSHRLVIVENADPFVTKYRTRLEQYVAEPASYGVLVLDVASWTATTRLAKLLTESTIICKAPAVDRLPAWCVDWAKARHGKQLVQAAAQFLVDLIGTDMGVLDQEIAKLAVYVGTANEIKVDDVDRLVARSRLEDIWLIFDAIAAGRSGEALAILDKLLEGGEDVFRLAGAFSMQLRRLAQVARLRMQGVPAGEALDRAGVPAWPKVRQQIEPQLKHLGRRRLNRLYDWVLEVEVGLRGLSELPARTLLERLVVRLAAPPQ
jgi:DNA polymerase-3 subunit delta